MQKVCLFAVRKSDSTKKNPICFDVFLKIGTLSTEQVSTCSQQCYKKMLILNTGSTCRLTFDIPHAKIFLLQSELKAAQFSCQRPLGPFVAVFVALKPESFQVKSVLFISPKKSLQPV